MGNEKFCGKKGRSGGWNKTKTLDYSMLKRYSIAYLLKLMRNKSPDEEQDQRQFKTALEVVTKDIGKQVANTTVNNVNQYFFQSLLQRAGILDEQRHVDLSRN